MTNPDLAYITPKVLEWAISRSSDKPERIAKRVSITEAQLEAWAQGTSAPQFNKAIKLAEALHIPFGFLFLSEPPKFDLPLPDRRTLPNTQPRQPSIDFINLLTAVQARHDWYKDYALEHGARPLSFVGAFTVNGVKIVANSIRSTLAINEALRREARDLTGYLSLLSRQCEDSGILVMRSGVVGHTTRRLSVKEFQGFSVVDRIAPLIFVNAQDFKTAQVFTLAHELSHIWIGQSAIDNPDETGEGQVSLSDTVERFCNAVAAEVLVPEAEFLHAYEHPINLQKLSRRFKVSTLVVLRRAHDLGQLPTNRFFTLLKEEQQKLAGLLVGPVATEEQTGNFYNTAQTRLGRRFPNALLRDVKQGGTPYRDAAHLLGVKVPTVKKLIGRLT